MQILPVQDEKLLRAFLEVPVQLYKDDPNWIRPLDKDILDVFNKKKNKAYRFGETMLWLLQDDKGQLIGRIAAFTNKQYKNKGDAFAVGGMGFFECINRQDAADLLLDNAKHWLFKKGMGAMDGPINFGERDRWWGLVTAGYQPPLYGMNYNKPYYKNLLEHYGFKVFYNQICFSMKPKEPLSQKIWERHRQLSLDNNFHAEHAKKNNLTKYAQDFSIVYNKAWAGHGGLKQITQEQVAVMFHKMKTIMDEKIIWFVYYNNEPVGLFVNLPDLNQWFRYLNGKFNFLRKIQFLWHKTFTPNKKFVGLVFGIVPEWQGKGVDAYMIGEACRGYIQTNKCRYTEYEMQWIGDFNPKMINIGKGLGDVYESRRLATYRYVFDRTLPFMPHPPLI